MPLLLPELNGPRDAALLVAASGVVPLVVLPGVAAFVTTALAGRLALRGGSDGDHWSERARRLAPARVAATLAMWLVVGLSCGYAVAPWALLFPRPLFLAFFLGAAAAWFGGCAASFLLFRSTLPEPKDFRGFLRDQGVLAAVVMPQILILYLICAALYAAPSVRLTTSVVGVALWCGAAVYGGLPVARLLGRIGPASPKVSVAIAQAAARTGVVPRSVEEVDLPFANAFAVPLTGQVFFTRRAVVALTDAEVEAVAAHELGHLGEPRSVVWMRIAASLALLPIAFIPVLVDGLGWLGGTAAVYAAMLVVTVPLRRLQRRMEARADRAAACADGTCPALASALERMHELSLAPAVGLGRGTHPDLYDRMLAAGVTPAFPRPKRPSRVRVGIGLGGAVACAAGLITLHADAEGALAGVVADPVARSLAAIAVSGGSPRDLFTFARAQADADPAAALAIAAFLAERRPRDVDSVSLHAWALALNGRCRDAAGVMEEATRLAQARDCTCTALVEAAETLVGCTERPPGGAMPR